MTQRFATTISKYVGPGALSLALLATPALTVASPAQAMPVPGPDVTCLAPKGSPVVSRAPDTPRVSAATLARVARAADAASSDAARTTAAPPVYRVKVQIHIIHGRHRGESQLKRAGARTKVFRILQDGYDGAESPDSQPMGIVFDLKRITVAKNESWYHARQGSRADRQMKKRLHRGTAQTLNIYVNKARAQAGFAGLLLGYSTFPWNYSANKKLDGVTVSVLSLPIRHSRTGYNLGDTVVHETGHWLGLLHTFEGGCSGPNDSVADTPAEIDSRGNQFCADLKNLCDPSEVTVGGLFDPAYNFMEYTMDACMRMFTAGQRQRVDGMYLRFRLGR